MKISVFAPVKNEAPWIGYSILDCLDSVHEFIYACAESDDGTDELLAYIKDRYAGEKLKVLRAPEFNFDPHDMESYNNAFNVCIKAATGDALWFKHPDMIVTNPEAIQGIKAGPLAWWTNMTSYAGDFKTQITKGRATRWKNIHANKFGLHYYGGYGSINEDMYHRELTGKSYAFHGTEFKRYPFQIADSGIRVNHYCELKGYKRRFEKMKSCLKTLAPSLTDKDISEIASKHPRVTLEPTTDKFGRFEFQNSEAPIPSIFQKHEGEFNEVMGRKVA